MDANIYIESWLQVKEGKKYETFWCVLQPTINSNGQLSGAELQFYVDRNIMPTNFHASIHVNFQHGDSVGLLKVEGNKEDQCKFTVVFQTVDHSKTFNKMKSTELIFKAYEDILRERWIYALCDLVAHMKPPEELPTKYNGKIASRPRKYKKPRNLLSVRSLSLSEIMAPVPLQQNTGPFIPLDSNANVTSPSAKTSPVKTSPVKKKPPTERTGTFLEYCNWYYGKITRRDSLLVLSKEKVGAYLLRDSSQSESYALSYKDVGNQIQHVLVEKNRDGQFSVDNGLIIAPTPTEACRNFLQKYCGEITCYPCCSIPRRHQSEKTPPSRKRVTQVTRQNTLPSNFAHSRPYVPVRARYEVMPEAENQVDEEDGYIQLNRSRLNIKDGPPLKIDDKVLEIEEEDGYLQLDRLPSTSFKDRQPYPENDKDKAQLTEEKYVTMKGYMEEPKYVTMEGNVEHTPMEDEYLKMGIPREDKKRDMSMRKNTEFTLEDNTYFKMNVAEKVSPVERDVSMKNINEDDEYLSMDTPPKDNYVIIVNTNEVESPYLDMSAESLQST